MLIRNFAQIIYKSCFEHIQIFNGVDGLWEEIPQSCSFHREGVFTEGTDSQWTVFFAGGGTFALTPRWSEW